MNVVSQRNTMTSHPYIFNKTLEQLRLVGARGGRAFGRNERARRALMPASSEAATPRLPARQTTADAIASLDRQFSWLRNAEKRHSRRNQIATPILRSTGHQGVPAPCALPQEILQLPSTAS
jgi:hypothetical protein